MAIVTHLTGACLTTTIPNVCHTGVGNKSIAVDFATEYDLANHSNEVFGFPLAVFG